MKISELIEKLQEDLKIMGDVEVVYQCDCFDCGCFEIPDCGIFPIGGTGWFGGGPDGENKVMIICAECNAEAIDDHIRGKYGY